MRPMIIPMLVVLALTTSCGSDEPAAADQAGIRIGVLANETGPDDGENLVRPVMAAWADHINAAGGIAGRDVELQFEDTKADPSAAAAAAKRLTSDDSIDAIVVFGTRTPRRPTPPRSLRPASL